MVGVVRAMFSRRESSETVLEFNRTWFQKEPRKLANLKLSLQVTAMLYTGETWPGFNGGKVNDVQIFS